MNYVRPKAYNLKSKVNPSSGFTLVETLIYAALISIIISMIIVVAFQVISNSSKLGDTVFIAEEVSFLLRKVEWAIGSASAINSPLPGNTSNILLSVDRFGVPAEENPMVFAVDSGSLTLKRGAGEELTLNSSLLNIQNATFTHIAATGTVPAGVKVELSVSGPDQTKTKSYEITTYLRQ